MDYTVWKTYWHMGKPVNVIGQTGRSLTLRDEGGFVWPGDAAFVHETEEASREDLALKLVEIGLSRGQR